MTPEKLETLFLMTLAIFLMGGDELVSNMVQVSCKQIAFSLVSCPVSVTEFITNPRTVRTCVGTKVDFLGCTTNLFCQATHAQRRL